VNKGEIMIDPVTAIGLATTAYNGIKSAIATGREIQDMGSQLGQWAKAISDLDYAIRKLKSHHGIKPWGEASRLMQWKSGCTRKKHKT